MIQDLNITRKDWILTGILGAVIVAALLSMIGPPKKLGRGMGVGQGNILSQGGSPGKESGQYDYPRGIAVNADGDYVVADSRNHRIQFFRGKDNMGVWETGGFARIEGGDAKRLTTESPGMFNEPNGVSFGPDGNVYVVDTWNNRIQVLDPKKGKVKKILVSDDGFFAPRELVVDKDGSVYVADTGRHRVVKFGPKGERLRVIGSPKGKGTGDGEFNEPIGLALDPAGNLFVADRLNFRIQVFNAMGQFVRKFSVNGWETDQIDMEPHLAVDADHDRVYATDGRGHQILRFTLEGKTLPKIDKNSDGQPMFKAPIGVAVDRDGNLFVADAGAAKIMKIKPE